MTTRTLGNAYTAVLLIVGAALTLIGSLTSGSVGATAAVAFGAAAVTAGLVLLGIRLTTPGRQLREEANRAVASGACSGHRDRLDSFSW